MCETAIQGFVIGVLGAWLFVQLCTTRAPELSAEYCAAYDSIKSEKSESEDDEEEIQSEEEKEE